jgi:signal transduction histidine kinase
VLFKSARELLFNVVKHASVQRASVSLQRVPGYVNLTIADEGRGFDMAAMNAVSSIEKGLGLFNVRGWLQDIGGRMEIDSKPGFHTRVTLYAPLETAQSSDSRTEK